MKRVIWSIVLGLCVLLGGCNMVTTQRAAHAAVETKEREIAQLNAQFDAQLSDARKAYDLKLHDLIAAKDAQMQGAADAFYGQTLVFRSIIQPVRTDLLFNNLADEGWASLGHIQPTYDAMKAMNERIARELDATKTSLADLQKSHDAAVAQNTALAQAEKAREKEVGDLKAAIMDIEHDRDQKIAAKQQELIRAQNHALDVETARANRQAARDAALAKLSWGAGALAAALLLGAIFSPVFKPQLGLGAAILGAAAVAIPFLEPVYILICLGAGFALLVGWAILTHHGVDKLSDNLVLGLQNVKNTAPETWAKIRGTIQDALGKYTKTPDGKTVVTPDPKMEALVDAKLKDYQALSAPMVTVDSSHSTATSTSTTPTP